MRAQMDDWTGVDVGPNNHRGAFMWGSVLEATKLVTE
jgi:hypothetical protein